MKVLQQLFDFYVNSSIHVALAVYSLSWITLMECGVDYDENVLYFIFYASITGYNFVKFFGLAKFHHRKLASWLKSIQVFSFFCFLAMCYYLLQLNKTALYCIVGFAAVTFFYAVPFLPKRLFLDHKHNLRTVAGLKIYLIALTWSGVTVFLPLINNEYIIDTDVVLTGIQRFVFVIVLMLPFEIRDLKFDSLKLSTVPQKIGVKQTKLLGVLLLCLILFLEFFKDETSYCTIFVLVLITIITGMFVVFSKIAQGKYYSAFWVEGLPILWLVLWLLIC